MDSHSESEEGNMASGGMMDERNKTLAAAAAALPGINYMTAHFPMPPGSEMPMMHPLGMPFFPQSGGQFLASGLSGMPMFLHPASLARSLQQGSMSSPVNVKDVRSNMQQQPDMVTSTAYQVGPGMISHSLLQFPSIYMPQQLSQGEEQSSVDGQDKRSPLQHEGLVLPFNLFSGLGQTGMQLAMQQQLQQQQQHQQQQQLQLQHQQLQQHQQQQQQQQQHQQMSSKEDAAKNMKQPKRALTPYMRFSKEVWQSVKAQNPDLSVCAIGAAIGRMWRELPAVDKEKYNEEFSADKIRYEGELQRYLKATGLHASDLTKSSRARKKDLTTPYSHPNQSGGTGMQQLPTNSNRAQQQQMEMNAQDQVGATGLPAFSQIWAAGGMPMLAGMAPIPNEADAEQARDGQQSSGNNDNGVAMWQALEDGRSLTQQHLPPPMYNPLTIQNIERARHDTWQQAASENSRPGSNSHSHGSPKVAHQHENVTYSHARGNNAVLQQNGPVVGNDKKASDANDGWGDILGLASFAEKHQQHGSGATASNRGGENTALLETEVVQLRGALSEKTREAQRLTADLEQAHDLIGRLQQQLMEQQQQLMEQQQQQQQLMEQQQQLMEQHPQLVDGPQQLMEQQQLMEEQQQQLMEQHGQLIEQHSQVTENEQPVSQHQQESEREELTAQEQFADDQLQQQEDKVDQQQVEDELNDDNL